MYMCTAVQCSCIYYNAAFVNTVQLYIIITIVIITNITIICLLSIVLFTTSDVVIILIIICNAFVLYAAIS